MQLLRFSSRNVLIIAFAGVPNARQETEIWDKSSQKNPKPLLQWNILLQTGDDIGLDFHLHQFFQHWKLLFCIRFPTVRPLTRRSSFPVLTTIAFQSMIRWNDREELQSVSYFNCRPMKVPSWENLGLMNLCWPRSTQIHLA